MCACEHKFWRKIMYTTECDGKVFYSFEIKTKNLQIKKCPKCLLETLKLVSIRNSHSAFKVKASLISNEIVYINIYEFE